MNKLSFSSCEHVSEIQWPSRLSEVSLNSKAIEVVTDFTMTRPLVIDSNTKAVEAEYLMKKAHVKLKLVVDEHNHFIGTLSFNDLNDQELIKKVAHGDVRSELRVVDFMRAKTAIKSIFWEALSQASLKTLMHLLANCDEQHVLLTDNNGRTLRGLVSASDIARALHLDINLTTPISFKLVYHALGAVNPYAA